MPRKVNKAFVGQTSNPSRPPLPLNYPAYVKDSDPNVHVKVFKVAIRTNGETKNAKIVNMFTIQCLTTVIITWDTTQIILL
jgi:hypothetical protein